MTEKQSKSQNSTKTNTGQQGTYKVQNSMDSAPKVKRTNETSRCASPSSTKGKRPN